MSRTQLSGLILGSALVTLDGTATTIALPALARDLNASMTGLQWIANAPLLALSALLLPAGTVGDRFGHARVFRLGVAIFVTASAACVAAPSSAAMIAARVAQGVGGALILPTSLALLRAASDDPAERTRIFGLWAACTGAASAVGPLVAGTFVDALSWRATFVLSAVAGLAAIAMTWRHARRPAAAQGDALPITATAAWVALVGCAAFTLIEGTRAGVAHGRFLVPIGIAIVSAALVIRDPGRRVLLPPALLNARNCMAANLTDFALYFGLFGLSFVLTLYVQQVLHDSALWSASVLLPISLMLLLAERFGRLTAKLGTRPLSIGGALTAGAGVLWIGFSPHPVPFWSHLIAGTTLFGLGMSVSVSSLTHAAVAAVPTDYAGAASGLNHAVVRTAGFIAVALLGSIATDGSPDALTPGGFRSAVLVCAVIVTIGGMAGSAALRDHDAGGVVGQS